MKNLKHLLSNQKGMSLIELTVAAAISVIISMGVVKTNQTGVKGMNKIKTDLDLRMWKSQQLYQSLSDGDTCVTTFGGAGSNVSAAGDVSPIYDTSGAPLIAVNEEVLQSGWIVTSIRKSAWQTIAGDKGKFQLTLMLRRKEAVNDTKRQGFGGQDTRINIEVVGVASGGGTSLVSCSGGGESGSYWALEQAVNPYLHSQNRAIVLGSAPSSATASLQIDTISGNDWLSGPDKAIRIANADSALIFGADGYENAGIYIDDANTPADSIDDCLILANGSNGTIAKNISLCQNGQTNINVPANQQGFVNHTSSWTTAISANGDNSTTINNSDETLLSGQWSSVISTYAGHATGSRSVVLGGSRATSTANYSVATGHSDARGIFSFAQGEDSVAVGRNSIAMGKTVYAGGTQGSIAIGDRVAVGKNWGIGIGNDIVVGGTGAMVLAGKSGTTITANTRNYEFTAQFEGGFRFLTGTQADNTSAHVGQSVYISSSGNLAVGSIPGDNHKLEVNGNAYFNGHTVASNYWTPSDRRLKEDVVNLEGSLEKILKIRGVSYNWINPEKRNGNKKEIGVIAQELEEIYPDLVQTIESSKDVKNRKTVSYVGLIAPLVESVKELYTIVMDMFSEQDERIVQLENENSKLKAELEDQRKILLEIQSQMHKKQK